MLHSVKCHGVILHSLLSDPTIKPQENHTSSTSTLYWESQHFPRTQHTSQGVSIISHLTAANCLWTGLLSPSCPFNEAASSFFKCQLDQVILACYLSMAPTSFKLLNQSPTRFNHWQPHLLTLSHSFTRLQPQWLSCYFSLRHFHCLSLCLEGSISR